MELLDASDQIKSLLEIHCYLSRHILAHRLLIHQITEILHHLHAAYADNTKINYVFYFMSKKKVKIFLSFLFFFLKKMHTALYCLIYIELHICHFLKQKTVCKTNNFFCKTFFTIV